MNGCLVHLHAVGGWCVAHGWSALCTVRDRHEFVVDGVRHVALRSQLELGAPESEYIEVLW